jgi:hypothetical protein
MKQYTSVFASKKDQVARTPSYLVRAAKELFLPSSVERFFDPCPDDWTPESQWNALDPNQPWGDFNFVNPPFDQTAKFFKRAIEQQDRALSVFLVPPRFHTRYFANALPNIRRIVLINHRVRFVGYKDPLQSAVCFVVFGPAELTYPLDSGVEGVHPIDVGFYVAPKPLTIPEVKPPNAHLLHGALSEPLSDILRSEEPSSVLCAARLDNKVVIQALTTADTYAVFICPTLRHETSKQKFLEGSMLLSTHGSEGYKHLEGHRRFAAHVLHSLSQTTHSEEEYERLLQK